MPDRLLDEVDRRAALKGVGAMAVTQIVVADASSDPSPTSSPLRDPQQVARVHRPARLAARKDVGVIHRAVPQEHDAREHARGDQNRSRLRSFA